MDELSNSVLTQKADFSLPSPPSEPVAPPTINTETAIVLRNISNELLPATRLLGMGTNVRGIDPSALESIGSGFRGIGVATGAGKWLLGDGDEFTSAIIDPNYNLPEWVKEDPGRADLVKHALKHEHTDDGWNYLIKRLESSANVSQGESVISDMQRYLENKEVSDAAHLGWWLIGAGGSLSIDLLVGALVSGPLGLSRAVVTNTVAGARAAASVRVAAFGATEAGLEAVAQGLTSPDITVDDVALATGAGGLFGGILGRLFPGFFGQTISAESVERAAIQQGRDLAIMAREADGNLSAAKVNADVFESNVPAPGLTSPTATRGTGSLIAGKLLRGPLKHLRTPKRMLADAIKQATADRAKGLVGNDRLTAILSRMYKISTQTAEDQLGVARVETMQEGLEMLQTRLTIHEFQAKNLYSQFVSKAFGKSSVRNTLLNNDLTGDIVRKMGQQMPSQAEMRRVADLFAQARGEGDLAGAAASLDMLRGRIPTEFMGEYESAIKRMADHDDEWYQKFGNAEVAEGFIKAADLKPGYRSQNWNYEVVQSRLTEFTNQVEELISETPDIPWVADAINSIARRADDEAEGDIPDISPDDTWEDVVTKLKDNPQLLQDIIEDWDEIKRIARLDAREATEAAIAAEVDKFVDESIDTILEKSGRVRMRWQRQVASYEAELTDLKQSILAPSTRERGRPDTYSAALRIDELATTIGRLEQRIENEAGLVHRLQSLKAKQARLQEGTTTTPSMPQLRIRLNSIQEEMRRLTTEAGRQGKDARGAAKRLSKAQRATSRAAGRLALRDTAAKIAAAISKQRSPGGFHVDDALETTRFFKRRQLNLKGVRHKEEWQRFLNTDSSTNMEIYTQSVGRQLEMRRKYLPHLREEGVIAPDGEVDVYEGLSTWLRQGFDEDQEVIRRTMSGGEAQAELARLEDTFTEAREFMKKAFGEFTRSDYLSHANETADRLVSIAQSASSATMLGKVLLSSVTDVAIVAFAGSRFGVGLLDMFRQLRNQNILADIAQDDEMLAMVLRGERVMSNSIMTSRFDLDSPSLQVPGGMLSKVQRTASSLAQVTMWTNLLHPWNRVVRSSFGIGFMRQIAKDLERYDSLPADLKGFYAKHGIGANEAKRMTAQYAKNSKTVNGIKVPDLHKWALDGDDDLVETFYRAVNGAGNEALLDPGLGDRPFLRSSPFGRLILQFQSFTFTAGERWFAPMIQQGLMRPTDARFLTSAMIGLAFAALANEARDTLAGREGKLSKALDGDGQAAWEVIKESWLRSPLSIGMQGVAFDNLGTFLANPVNLAYQSVTGSEGEILNSEHLRYRQGQGFYSLLGPGAGLVLGTIPKVASDVFEGDVETLRDTVMARAPVINALPFIFMAYLSDKVTGD